MRPNKEDNVDIEFLGTCTTNTTPDSQHDAIVEPWHLWSYAQQAAFTAVSEQGVDACYRLIRDPERRAKRIAASYADLYFRSYEESNKQIQFYWVALAAFVVKDIVVAYEYAREEVLNGPVVKGEIGNPVFDSYRHAMRTYAALAKGNLWLFMDIYPWLWFYLEYCVRKDGSINEARLNSHVDYRDSNTFQRQSKGAVEGLPFGRKWLGDCKKWLANNEVHVTADQMYEGGLKTNVMFDPSGGTAANRAAGMQANAYVRREMQKDNSAYCTPSGKYWGAFKQAFYVMDAQKSELTRFADDNAALARLDKIRQFKITKEVKQAYEAISMGVAQAPASKQAELLKLAEQEQKNVLQPLIYDDPKLKESLDLNHTVGRHLGKLLAPYYQVVFTENKDTDDPDLKVRFDPPTGVVDWFKGANKSLADVKDRMEFVGKIADQFNKLMSDKDRKPQLERSLKKIQGWLNA